MALQNPFQSMDVSIPIEWHEYFAKYCQTRGDHIDRSPFPRMVDFWFMAVCIAARLGLEPVDVTNRRTRKIIEGSIFGSDPWRIYALMLIAIAREGDVGIVAKPARVLALANGLAAAGVPKVVEMMQDGEAAPIWNLSDAIEQILRNQNDV